MSMFMTVMRGVFTRRFSSRSAYREYEYQILENLISCFQNLERQKQPNKRNLENKFEHFSSVFVKDM